MAEYEQIGITIPKPILEQVDRRGKWRSTIIGRDLGRYYSLLRHTLNDMPFRLAEVMLLCDALNGVIITPETVSLLADEVEAAIREDRLDEKWQIDGKEFVARLRALNRLEATAVVDGVELVWEDVSGGGATVDMEAAIRRVFVIRD